MMAAGAAVALALWLLLPAVGVGEAGPPPIQDGEFTFLLPAGRKQCFYQSAPANASLETEYQVRGSRLGIERGLGAWSAGGRGGAGVWPECFCSCCEGALSAQSFLGPGGCWIGYY